METGCGTTTRSYPSRKKLDKTTNGFFVTLFVTRRSLGQGAEVSSALDMETGCGTTTRSYQSRKILDKTTNGFFVTLFVTRRSLGPAASNAGKQGKQAMPGVGGEELLPPCGG